MKSEHCVAAGYLLAAVVRAAAAAAAGRAAEAEGLFRGLLEAIPDAMVIVDGAGVIRLVNARAEVLFGYSHTELAGRSAELLVPEWFRGRAVGYRPGLADAGQSRSSRPGQVVRGLRHDGREFLAEVSLSPLPASGGLVACVVRDVSGREAGRQRISVLDQIVESSQDAVLTKTLGGTVTSWNPAAARLYGYSAAEVVGRDVSVLVPPGGSNEIGLLLGRLRRGEHICRYRTRRVTKTGRVLVVDLTLAPVRDSARRITSACAIARDLTSREHIGQDRCPV